MRDSYFLNPVARNLRTSKQAIDGYARIGERGYLGMTCMMPHLPLFCETCGGYTLSIAGASVPPHGWQGHIRPLTACVRDPGRRDDEEEAPAAAGVKTPPAPDDSPPDGETTAAAAAAFMTLFAVWFTYALQELSQNLGLGRR